MAKFQPNWTKMSFVPEDSHGTFRSNWTKNKKNTNGGAYMDQNSQA